MSWPLLWKLMFVLVTALFALMAVCGTVLGARDVRRLLRHFREEEAGGKESGKPPREQESEQRGGPPS